MDLGLQGKTILIAGMPGEFSGAISTAFRREGAFTALCLGEGAPDPGCADAFFACDLADEAAALRLRGELETRFGGVDAVVFEATAVEQAAISGPDGEAFRKRLLPARAAFVCCRVFGGGMGSGGRGGAMLFVTTVHDEKPNGFDFAHSVVAGMIQNLVMEAALEYGPCGVRVNQLAVGAMEGFPERFPSELTTFYDGCCHKAPCGRLGTAGDAADLAVLLVSGRAGFTSGARLRMDGGMSLHYVDYKANIRAQAAGGEGHP